jgi:hypothetical protein
MKRERVSHRDNTAGHGLTAGHWVISRAWQPAHREHVPEPVRWGHSLRRMLTGLVAKPAALALLTCVSCDSDSFGLIVVHTPDSVSAFPAEVAAIARSPSEWNVLQRDASCPEECALQSDRKCPPAREVMSVVGSDSAASEYVVDRDARVIHAQSIETQCALFSDMATPVDAAQSLANESAAALDAVVSRGRGLDTRQTPPPGNETAVEVSLATSFEMVACPDALVSREHGVEARRTPLSGTEAAKRLERAYRRQVGRRPNPEALALLTAHWAHETNQGASMFNYNFGGIKGVGPEGAYVLNRTREGSGGHERRKSFRFRAYANAADGAMDYVDLLQRLYGRALRAAGEGDAEGFVRALKQGGYFSGDEGVYLQKVTEFVSLAEQWGFDALGPSGIAPRHKPTRDAWMTGM